MLSIRVLVFLLAVTFVAAFPSGTVDGDKNALKIEDDEELLPSKESESAKSESRNDFRNDFGSENDIENGQAQLVDLRFSNGKYFQGDIQMSQDMINLALSNHSLDSRTGIRGKIYRWPKNIYGEVVVPYNFHAGSSYSQSQKYTIISAMDTIEYYTCIKFVKRTNEKDFVLIHSGDGCSSNIGKQGGQQNLSLRKNGCVHQGIVMHELIHALGYDHMHNHVDRDRFVEINWKNIIPEQIHNFEKVNPRMFSNFGTAYDMHSIMHYEKTAFSRNDQNTIVPRNRRFWNVVGQRHSLSRGDAARINNMYQCCIN